MYRIILSNNNFATQIHKYETKADIAFNRYEIRDVSWNVDTVMKFNSVVRDWCRAWNWDDWDNETWLTLIGTRCELAHHLARDVGRDETLSFTFISTN